MNHIGEKKKPTTKQQNLDPINEKFDMMGASVQTKWKMLKSL